MLYKSRYLDLTLILVISYSIFYIAHKFYGGKIPFWDFHITYCASKTFFLENFPYGLNVHGDCLHPNITLTANYSPGTLEILKYLGSLNIISANILWVFFEIISFFIIFYVMKKIFKFNYNLRNLLLIIFSFGGTIFFSFISGNLSFILYGFIALGIYFLYLKKFNYFYLTILFVSLFKFYYLTFLLLPFYILGWKSLKNIFLYFFFFILIQYFFYLKNPELTIAFLDIIQGNFQEDLPTRFQTGTGLYSIIEKIPWILLGINSFDKSFFAIEINLLLWLFASFTIFFGVFLCLNNKKIKSSSKHFLFCISFGILVVNLIIPRLVVYDLILTIPILFYILNQINFKNIFKKKIYEYKLKFCFIFLSLVIFDHHFPFFVIIFFLMILIYSEINKKTYFIY